MSFKQNKLNAGMNLKASRLLSANVEKVAVQNFMGVKKKSSQRSDTMTSGVF